ncbi:MAG: hypothetical protein MZU97_13880 [Bacillus subtilis]|nr:hypothetical protein [Bacillus subtilis]
MDYAETGQRIQVLQLQQRHRARTPEGEPRTPDERIRRHRRRIRLRQDDAFERHLRHRHLRGRRDVS